MKRMSDILALLAVVMFSTALVGLFKIDFPDGNKEVILVVIGALTAILKDVYGYHFGSSAGERNGHGKDGNKDGSAPR